MIWYIKEDVQQIEEQQQYVWQILHSEFYLPLSSRTEISSKLHPKMKKKNNRTVSVSNQTQTIIKHFNFDLGYKTN